MVRIIIDKLGDGHHDIFLIVDMIPKRLYVADSFYLQNFLELQNQDFLNLSNEDILKKEIMELLKHWRSLLKMVNKHQQVFLPFALSDECMGGLLLNKNRRGFKLAYVFTTNLNGHSNSKSNLYQDVLYNQTGFFVSNDGIEWLIDEEVLLNGLSWSINEL